MIKQKSIFISILSLSFLLIAGTAFAALTFNSTAITSDGNLQLTAPSGLITIGPAESTLDPVLQGWTGAQTMLITSLNQNTVAGIESDNNNNVVVFNPVSEVHGPHTAFVNEAQAFLDGNGGTAYALAGSISVNSGSTANTGDGLYIENPGLNGSIQNLRGIDISPQLGGTTTSYNIFSEGATSQNRFEGKLTVGPDDLTTCTANNIVGCFPGQVTLTAVATDPTNQLADIKFQTLANPSADSTTNYGGIDGGVISADGNTHNINNLYNFLAAYHQGSGNVTRVQSLFLDAEAFKGSGPAGSVTNLEGLHIFTSIDTDAVTNAYGLRVDDVSGATNNYAIKTGLGAVDLGDSLVLRKHINTGAANNDLDGTISISSSTSASYTFATAFNSAPACTLTPITDPTALGAYWATTTTSALTAHVHTSGSITFVYHCVGNPN
jgi:hypothetical protein